ncbi:MAG: hypothetical protein HC794_04445 [Nitrospiraceae bacterium]|nr:hypothetical protein [Nitrospiraceae bacterium]
MVNAKAAKAAEQVLVAAAVFDFALSIFTLEPYGLVHFFLAFFASFVLWAAAIRSGQDAQGLPAPRRLGRAFLLSFLIAFALVMVAVTPPMYGAGLVTARTLMIVRFTQLGLFALWGYWAAVGLARSHRLKRLEHSTVYRLVTWEVLAAFVIIPALVLIRHGGLVGNFATYARQWDARHAALIQARDQGETSFIVAPLDYNLEEYLSLDRMEKAGTEADTEWVTRCMSDYYGLDVSPLYPPEIVNPD